MNEEDEVRMADIERMVREAMQNPEIARYVYRGDVSAVSETLYDLGYRKFEIVDEEQ